MIIMILPSMADTMLLDATTVFFVINNMHKLEFDSIEIVNLFSKVDTKLRLKDGLSELIGEETNDIIKSVEKKSMP